MERGADKFPLILGQDVVVKSCIHQLVEFLLKLVNFSGSDPRIPGFIILNFCTDIYVLFIIHDHNVAPLIGGLHGDHRINGEIM